MAKKIIRIENGRKKVVTINELPSKTDPSWQKDCDVNHIMTKFMKTGQINHLAKKPGNYMDVSEIKDLPEALMQVKSAENAFYSLSAAVRREFDNDPVKMVQFLQDPANNERAIELGLKVGKAEKPSEAEATKKESQETKKEVSKDGTQED